MADTILLSESNTVVLACSVCNHQKVVDISQYLSRQDIKKLKIKCKCGHSWNVNLEKKTSLPKTNLFAGRLCYL